VSPEASGTPEAAALLHLGEVLRRVRREAGLTGTELAGRTGISQSRLSKIENGKYGLPDWRDVDRILDGLGASRDVRDSVRRQHEICELDPASFRFITATGSAAKQLQLAAIERRTRLFRVFESAVVPGLLQTFEYSVSLLMALGETEDSARAGAEARGVRQRVLSESARNFRFVMMGWALRSNVTLGLPGECWEAQLGFLERMSFRKNVEIRIVSARMSIPIATANPFSLYDRRYVSGESVTREEASSDPADIGVYEKVFRGLWAAGVELKSVM
jgi:transcriptional regulator with XRE-family HTH domain